VSVAYPLYIYEPGVLVESNVLYCVLRILSNHWFIFHIFLQGVIEDRIGYFPAAYVHQAGIEDQVFRCNRTFIGCKEQGQITLKEGQVLYTPTV